MEDKDVKHFEKQIYDLEKYLIEKIEHLRTEVKDEKDSAKLAREIAISALDKHLAALNNATAKDALAKDTFADKALFELEMKGIHKEVADIQTANKVADAIVQDKASIKGLEITRNISYISIAIALIGLLLRFIGM